MSQVPSQVNSPGLFSETGSFSLRNLGDYAQLKAQNKVAKAQLDMEKVKIDQLAEQFNAEMGQRQSEQAAAQQENEAQRAFQADQVRQSQEFQSGQNELDRRIREQEMRQADEQFIKLREFEIAKIESETQKALSMARTQAEIDMIRQDREKQVQAANDRLQAAKLSFETSTGLSEQAKSELIEKATSMDSARSVATQNLLGSVLKPVQQAVLIAALKKSKEPKFSEMYGPAPVKGVIEGRELEAASRNPLTSQVADAAASAIAGQQGFEGVRDQVRDYLYASLQLADAPDDKTAQKMASDARDALLKTGRIDAYQARELLRGVAGAMDFSEATKNDMLMTQMVNDLRKGVLEQGIERVTGGNTEDAFYKDFINNSTKELSERSQVLRRAAGSLFAGKDIIEPGQLTSVFVAGLTDGRKENDAPLIQRLQSLRGQPGGEAFLMTIVDRVGTINTNLAKKLRAELDIQNIPKEIGEMEKSYAAQFAELNRRGYVEGQQNAEKQSKALRESVRRPQEK